MPRRKNDAPLLDRAHTGCRAAMRLARSLAHLDKDQCVLPIIRLHNQINLATAAPWCFVVTSHQPQSRRLQMRQRQIFST